MAPLLGRAPRLNADYPAGTYVPCHSRNRDVEILNSENIANRTKQAQHDVELSAQVEGKITATNRNLG